MSKLHELFELQGQSPWLDNLRREWLLSGEIQAWIDAGVRGITSNPSIFQKAIESSEAYTEQLAELVAQGASVEDSYWSLVLQDIESALSLLRPIFDESNGGDGFVSLEVSPLLAHDTLGTKTQARSLWSRVNEPNLLIKIPATLGGLEAISGMTAEGISVNVTLIFSLERYASVMESYISGLEQALLTGETDLSHISSVGSFFISRVDTEVDRRLMTLGTPEAMALRGTAAVTQGQLAFAAFAETFDGPRWERLAAHGARVQRPLWASTSAKSPDLPDTLYVDSLIGPDSVNTLPDATLLAFQDHGTVLRTVDVDVAEARRHWERLGNFVDLEDVARVLEAEGVMAFERSFVELLDVLRVRCEALTSEMVRNLN
ncbi:MAG: transaldolase [Microthrixaceae bacterium]